MTAGYSGTPLVKKLGIKAGYHVAFVHAPDHLMDLLGALPDGVAIHADFVQLQESLDFLHAFYADRASLKSEFSQLKAAIRKDGMIWISWYKKASKIPTDLNENIIREIGLEHGLVDVKVAAIDNLWSGLKFVYRLEDR